MSAILHDHPTDPRVAQLLADHNGDPEAALLACLLHIDRLAARLEEVSYATSRGYSRGATRRDKAVAVGAEVSVPAKEMLNL